MTPLKGISSMATRQLLTELAAAFHQTHDRQIEFESIGGVDAAKRVASGEPFDVVVLASDAIDKLIIDGHVLTGSKTDLARSSVAIAVKSGSRAPSIGTAIELRKTVLAAKTVGYSTGPSGVAITKLLEHWIEPNADSPRLVQSPPGVPVGQLIADGEVDIGFQQLSELMHLTGIGVIGLMPPGLEIDTIFSAGLCSVSDQPKAGQLLVDFLGSPATAEAKLKQGMRSVTA